jgi:putative addiction module component (TIGR02574 family)
MIGVAEIERMNGAEKMEIMELLWRSMSAEPAKVPSSQWHRKILAQRLSKVEAGKGEFLTLTQFKKHVARRHA